MRRIVVSSFAFALVALVAGCKDKPKRQKPPENVSTATGSGGMRPAPDLMLPRSDGSPPKKTTKPLAKADFEKLAKLEFPGFTAEVKAASDNVFVVRHKTNDHPRLWAVVTIQPCLDCVPMELDKWKAKTEDLKVTLEGLKDKPGVDFTVGETFLNGQRVIYTHQVGTGTSPSPGGDSFSFTNVLYAYYNDGVNQIRVEGAYKDDPASKEDMLRKAPKADLEALALSFMDAYTHAW